ncbi:MAG: hypothetical protein K2P79_02710 [Sphingomonas sp.]|nr:hypothetical protein [Sphingomonas sp.]
MTAAYRFRGLGWFLSGVVVVLGFYLVSLQVAAERKKVADVSRAIATAQREIRALETEFNTRANLAQLERWNGDVLALTSPNADQFVADEAALAQLDLGGGGAQVANVAYVVPAGLPAPQADAAQAAPATALAATQAASAPTPAPAVMRTAEPAQPAARPVVRTVLASVAPVPPRAGDTQRNPRRTQAVAMLDRSLLSDATIGDLVDGARAEAGGLR